jgi:hypothetical protein
VTERRIPPAHRGAADEERDEEGHHYRDRDPLNGSVRGPVGAGAALDHDQDEERTAK